MSSGRIGIRLSETAGTLWEPKKAEAKKEVEAKVYSENVKKHAPIVMRHYQQTLPERYLENGKLTAEDIIYIHERLAAWFSSSKWETKMLCPQHLNDMSFIFEKFGIPSGLDTQMQCRL